MNEISWSNGRIFYGGRFELLAQIDGQTIAVYPEGQTSYSARFIANGHPLVVSNHRSLERAKQAAIDYAIKRAATHADEYTAGVRRLP